MAFVAALEFCDLVLLLVFCFIVICSLVLVVGFGFCFSGFVFVCGFGVWVGLRVFDFVYLTLITLVWLAADWFMLCWLVFVVCWFCCFLFGCVERLVVVFML